MRSRSDRFRHRRPLGSVPEPPAYQPAALPSNPAQVSGFDDEHRSWPGQHPIGRSRQQPAATVWTRPGRRERVGRGLLTSLEEEPEANAGTASVLQGVGDLQSERVRPKPMVDGPHAHAARGPMQGCALAERGAEQAGSASSAGNDPRLCPRGTCPRLCRLSVALPKPPFGTSPSQRAFKNQSDSFKDRSKSC